MKKVLLILILCLCARLNAQVPIVDSTGACNDNDVVYYKASTKSFECRASAAVPGIITFIVSGTCPTGWSEDASLVGKTLFGTSTANGDIGDTGGNDNITPTVNSLTAAAQIFTGNALGTHSHGIGTFANTAISAGTPSGTNSTSTVTPLGTNASSAVSGIVVDAHASHTHTYTDVIAHTHTQLSFNTTTGGSSGFTTDASMSGTTFTATQTTGSTGIATGTTAGPSASLTHNVSNNGTAAAQTFTGSSSTVGAQTFTGNALGTHNHTLSGSSESVDVGTPTGTNGTSAVTGTLNSFDNRSAFVKVIFCKKD